MPNFCKIFFFQIGVGSDIGGSIRMPSFFNGVFGMKPTPGSIFLNSELFIYF